MLRVNWSSSKGGKEEKATNILPAGHPCIERINGKLVQVRYKHDKAIDLGVKKPPEKQSKKRIQEKAKVLSDLPASKKPIQEKTKSLSAAPVPAKKPIQEKTKSLSARPVSSKKPQEKTKSLSALPAALAPSMPLSPILIGGITYIPQPLLAQTALIPLQQIILYPTVLQSQFACPQPYQQMNDPSTYPLQEAPVTKIERPKLLESHSTSYKAREAQESTGEKSAKGHEDVNIKTAITTTKHVCAECGILRSKRYHKKHPIKQGETPIPDFCGRCQRYESSLSDSDDDDDRKKKEHIKKRSDSDDDDDRKKKRHIKKRKSKKCKKNKSSSSDGEISGFETKRVKRYGKDHAYDIPREGATIEKTSNLEGYVRRQTSRYVSPQAQTVPDDDVEYKKDRDRHGQPLRSPDYDQGYDHVYDKVPTSHHAEKEGRSRLPSPSGGRAGPGDSCQQETAPSYRYVQAPRHFEPSKWKNHEDTVEYHQAELDKMDRRDREWLRHENEIYGTRSVPVHNFGEANGKLNRQDGRDYPIKDEGHLVELDEMDRRVREWDLRENELNSTRRVPVQSFRENTDRMSRQDGSKYPCPIKVEDVRIERFTEKFERWFSKQQDSPLRRTDKSDPVQYVKEDYSPKTGRASQSSRYLDPERHHSGYSNIEANPIRLREAGSRRRKDRGSLSGPQAQRGPHHDIHPGETDGTVLYRPKKHRRAQEFADLEHRETASLSANSYYQDDWARNHFQDRVSSKSGGRRNHRGDGESDASYRSDRSRFLKTPFSPSFNSTKGKNYNAPPYPRSESDNSVKQRSAPGNTQTQTTRPENMRTRSPNMYDGLPANWREEGYRPDLPCANFPRFSSGNSLKQIDLTDAVSEFSAKTGEWVCEEIPDDVWVETTHPYLGECESAPSASPARKR